MQRAASPTSDPLQALWRMRVEGQRPVGPVIVTASQRIADRERPKGMYVLLIDWNRDYDWRALTELDVIAVAEPTPAVIAAWQKIVAANPRTFHTTDGGPGDARVVIGPQGPAPWEEVYLGDENLQRLVDEHCDETDRKRVVIR